MVGGTCLGCVLVPRSLQVLVSFKGTSGSLRFSAGRSAPGLLVYIVLIFCNMEKLTNVNV